MNQIETIITKNVAGLYAEPSINSEQVTQAIMGQKVLIERDQGTWLYVQTWDTYHGWIQSRWVKRGVVLPERVAMVATPFTDAFAIPSPTPYEIKTKLVITSTLELLEKDHRLTRVRTLDGQDAWAVKVSEPSRSLVHVRLPDADDAWVMCACVSIIDSCEQELPIGPTGEELVRTARRFIGIPYLWGGTTPFGIDCSGFTQLVYKLNGINLLRDAGMQAKDQRGLSVTRTGLTAGDLIFFADQNDKTRVNHVGMACGDGTFIHSTGGVGVSINKLEEERYQRDFHSALRMI